MAAANLRAKINNLQKETADDITGFQKHMQVRKMCAFLLESLFACVCFFSVLCVTTLMWTVVYTLHYSSLALNHVVSLPNTFTCDQTLQELSSQHQARFTEAEAEYNRKKNRFPDKLPSE